MGRYYVKAVYKIRGRGEKHAEGGLPLRQVSMSPFGLKGKYRDGSEGSRKGLEFARSRIRELWDMRLSL